jgi:hypothetical protein
MLFDDDRAEDMINIKSSVRKERKRDEELNLKTDRNFE